MADILLARVAPTHRTVSVYPATCTSDAKPITALNPSIWPCRTETYSSPFLIVQDNKPKNISSISKLTDTVSFQLQTPTAHKYYEGDGISRAPAAPLSLSKEDLSLSPKRKLLLAILSHLLIVKKSHRKSSLTAFDGPGGGGPLTCIQDGPNGTIISKPPAIPHSTLILEALLQSPRNALSTKGICKHIMENYRWYSVNRHGGWQGEIFRELSENKAFEPMSIRRRGRSMEKIKWKMSDARREQLVNEFLNPNHPVSSNRVAQWAGMLNRSSSIATSTLVGSVRPESAAPLVSLGSSEILSPRATELPLTLGSPREPKRVSELPAIQEAHNLLESGLVPRSNFRSPPRDTYSPSQATELESPSSPQLVNLVTEICELDALVSFELSADSGEDRPRSVEHRLFGPSPPLIHGDLDYMSNRFIDSTSQQDCESLISTPVIAVLKPIVSPSLSPSAGFNETGILSEEPPCLLTRNRPNWKFQNRRSRRAKDTLAQDSRETMPYRSSTPVIATKTEQATTIAIQYSDRHPSVECSGSSAHDIKPQSVTNTTAQTNEDNSQSTEQTENSNDQTSNNSPESSSTQGFSRTISREISEDGNREQADESDNDRRRKKPRIRKPKESPTKRKFACIYHKYDPRTYSLAGDQTYRICQITGFKTISELLRHLGRVHNQWVCAKCLHSHQDEDSKKNCMHPVEIEQGRSAEATWAHLWRATFPNSPLPASQTWDLSNMFVAEQPSPPIHFGTGFSIQSNTASRDGLIDHQPNNGSRVQMRSTIDISNNFELENQLNQLEAKVELLGRQLNNCRCQHLQQKLDALEEQTKSMEAKLELLDLKLSQLNLGPPASNLINLSAPIQDNASSNASINSSSGESLANPETPPDVMLPGGLLAGGASMEYGTGCYNAGPWFDPLYNHYSDAFHLPMSVPLGPIDGGFGKQRQYGTGEWYESEQEHRFRVR